MDEDLSEPVEWEWEGGGRWWFPVCGDCHGIIRTSDDVCPHCGRRIRKENGGGSDGKNRH